MNQARVDQTERREALRCAEDSRPTLTCFLSVRLWKGRLQTSDRVSTKRIVPVSSITDTCCATWSRGDFPQGERHQSRKGNVF